MSRANKRVPAARPRAEFDSLPVTVDISPARSDGLGRLFMALFIIVVAVLFRDELMGMADRLDGSGRLASVGPLAVLGLSLYYAVRGLVVFLSRRSMTIDADGVTVTGRSPRGREEWRAPLSEFEGVSWRIVRRRDNRSSDNHSSRTRPRRVYHVLELLHPDAARTLPLHVGLYHPDDSSMRPLWERLARALGLPAIDRRYGAQHARAAEDLDKSVRELAAEGKAEFNWDPSAEPPPGLAWRSVGSGDDEALEVRLLVRRFPDWAYMVLGGAFALGAALTLIRLEILPALVLAAFAGLMYLLYRLELKQPRTLTVTRRDLTVSTPMVSKQETVPLTEIEEIRIVPPRIPLFGKGELLIGADRGETRTGSGLGREALEWLRNYLTAAVAEA